MKTILYSILGCMAIAQFSYAALPALEESIAEITAITDALVSNPSFNTVIPTSEAIVDIKRLTRNVNVTGTVRYKIVTRSVSQNDSSLEACGRCHRHHHHNSQVYIAVLLVSPNGIGPFLITVQSITQVSHSHHSIVNADAEVLLNQED